MLIRRSGEDDLAAVIALERATADAPHWANAEYARFTMLQPDGDADEPLRRCLLVATTEQGIVGFAVASVVEIEIGIGIGIVSASAFEGELESVVVARHARRQGTASALCGALLGWCQTAGAETVSLEVRSQSAGAIRLYERLGFSVTGRRVGYYSEPTDDALRMQCELSGPLQGALPAGSLHV